ncbi:hypothetical protein POM88_014332 [Heracleum sosnowskyi]|uniref:Uncharacterized protein n=1 Tax=Heracleum sosnowskyi TaxID=360622 RepID=A0AAD8J2S8_9APIA|nr:hypothetical protein POM88_014332 [Heracleum sosnowskyi]
MPIHIAPHTLAAFSLPLPPQKQQLRHVKTTSSRRIKVSNGSESYLDMWRKAVERERLAIKFNHIKTTSDNEQQQQQQGNEEVLEKKSSEFEKILQVSSEERDRVQRMQVIDRAAAAIAAARALLNETSLENKVSNGSTNSGGLSEESLEIQDGTRIGDDLGGDQNTGTFISSGNDVNRTPGPTFWSWIPPADNDRISDDEGDVKLGMKSSPSTSQTRPIIELERGPDILSIPFESKHENEHNPPLPPLQSLMEVEKYMQLKQLRLFIRWTLTRGVSADKAVEWEEKYWEAADDFDFKELGSEKSGRDSSGNVWREFWKETMYQKDGSVHLEKTADKWGRNGEGNEWQEKWSEFYGPSGQTDKWAHKWCSIDPNTPLEAGHAHVWHERWGEQYDGQGGSIKYTDKWAERFEGDGWTKWGDKWDEHFDPNSHGVKQGETWWEGKYGERWNRTWGEGHNGSGWVHKYGQSSSGEHWDTHEQQETWYERYPHYGFYHCFENAVQLRQVKKPSELT